LLYSFSLEARPFRIGFGLSNPLLLLQKLLSQLLGFQFGLDCSINGIRMAGFLLFLLTFRAFLLRSSFSLLALSLLPLLVFSFLGFLEFFFLLFDPRLSGVSFLSFLNPQGNLGG
jgi:hypothetical protein